MTTAVRYGHSADACTLTSAPNYTEAGNYTVYYEITYTYADTDMVEDGVAYVHLTATADGSCGCGCGDPDCDCQDPDCDGGCCNQDCEHHFVCHDTVAPSCMALGYDRLMCTECGKMVKANYKDSLGHAYQSIVVREATCETPGKTMDICERCGNVKESTIPQTEHEYETQVLPATCTSPGYTLNECAVCGDRHITDLTPALSHDYAAKTIPAGCETGGKTVHTCAGCGSTFVTDYTEPLGHSWDEGTLVTDATCTGEGIMEYTCTRCGATRLEGDAAAGHIPGDAATCTTPQLCTKCGAVIKNTLGHDYQEDVTAPTCTAMGFTTFTCSRCGDTYDGAYTNPTGHTPSEWIVDKEPDQDSAGSRHKECTVCGEVLETEELEKLYASSTTDEHGEAVVGRYLVIVTDTDSKAPVSGAAVELGGEEHLSIRLPDRRLLDYADQTTVTVQLVKDKSAVSDMSISVTDKNDNYASSKTDAAGQITVPTGSGKTNEDGKVTAGYEDADGDRWTLTIKVEHTDTGRPIPNAEVAIGKTGNITVKLPDGTDLDKNHRVTVTVTDHKKNPQENKNIIVKGDLSQTAKGKTDQDGKLTVPEIEERERHGTYILGYTDGTFGPSRSMTRAEAAAIFARLLAEKNGDTISTVANTRFTDIPAHAWYSGYAKYLNNNGVTYGKSKTIFAPNDAITRAEFTTLAVRFFDVYGDGDAEIMEQYRDFNDVSDGYWAAAYIKAAAKHGWINGYGDGSFRADDEINRAEVVTIVNRLLGREADADYIADNLRKLNTFPDVSRKHWAYYAVMEAANTHTAILGDSESWSK